MQQRQNYNRIYHELQERLKSIPKGAKNERGESLRDVEIRSAGVRPGSYYAWRRFYFGAKRSDAGQMRKQEFWSEAIEKVFALHCQVSDFENGRWMSSEAIISLAVQQKIIGEGVLSVRNYNLLVQKLRLKEQRGYTRLQADYANQVHQFDVSGSKYLQVLDSRAGEFILGRRNPHANLSKVQKAEKWRLWLFGVVDDYSGVFYLEYIVAAGESGLLAREFLDRAWRGVSAEFPLRGVPEILYTDNGPFAKAEATVSYLSQEFGVGVDHKVHMPYNSRATGKIERTWQTVKKSFELPFLANRKEFSLNEANAMLRLWCLEQAKREHRMLGGNRESVYLRSLTEHKARIPMENALSNAMSHFYATVDGSGVFRHENIFYKLPNQFINLRVLVYKNQMNQLSVEYPPLGLRSKAEIWEGAHGYGTFKSMPETEMDAVAKGRDKDLYGEIDHPFEKVTSNKVVPFIPQNKMPQKDTPFMDGECFRDALEAKKWLAVKLGIGLLKFAKEYPTLWAELNNLLDHTLNREEIAKWAEQVLNGQKQIMAGGGR